MSRDEAPTMPPSEADARALQFVEQVAEHDRRLRERRAPSSGLLRALALAEEFEAE